MRAWALMLVALQALSVSEGHAQAGYYCSEPMPPGCVDRFGTFDDEWAFDSCKREVESYLRDLNTFRSCLADWHSAAGDVADRTVRRFNCKASGDNFCP